MNPVQTVSTAPVPPPRVSSAVGLLPILLAVMVVLVYLPSTRNGFIYDDHKIILAHPGAATPGEIAQIFREPHFPRFPYYRPVTRSTLLIQKAMHGNRATPFHIVNAALMGLTAAAVFVLLRRPAFAIARGPALLCRPAEYVRGPDRTQGGRRLRRRHLRVRSRQWEHRRRARHAARTIREEGQQTER